MPKQNIQLACKSEINDLYDYEDALIKKTKSNIIKPSINLSNSSTSHRCIYRGKDLTNIYTIDQICQMISDGDFSDLYIGDYITITRPKVSYTYTYNTGYGDDKSEDVTDSSQKMDIVFADFNLFSNRAYNTSLKNHIVCIPRNTFSKSVHMNGVKLESGSYYGAYLNTDMYKIILPAYATALQEVLNNHILKHTLMISSEVNGQYPMCSFDYPGYRVSDTTVAYNVLLCLMNEIQVYGSAIMTSSNYDIKTDNSQFSLFRLAPELIRSGPYLNSTIRYEYWLRTSYGHCYFVTCTGSGNVTNGTSYVAHYIRPYFLIG